MSVMLRRERQRVSSIKPLKPPSPPLPPPVVVPWLYTELMSCINDTIPNVIIAIIFEYAKTRLALLYNVAPQPRGNLCSTLFEATPAGLAPVVTRAPTLFTGTPTPIKTTTAPFQWETIQYLATYSVCGTLGTDTYIHTTDIVAHNDRPIEIVHRMTRNDIYTGVSTEVRPLAKGTRISDLVCALGNRFYIGRECYHPDVRLGLYCYDPTRDSWHDTTCDAPMIAIEAHECGRAVALGNRMIACSGRHTRVTEAWDPRTNEGWRSLADMPESRSHFSMVAMYDHSFLVVGGQHSPGDTPSLRIILEYDTRNNQWYTHKDKSSRYPLLPEIKNGQAGAVDGTLVFVPRFQPLTGKTSAYHIRDGEWHPFTIPHQYYNNDRVLFTNI